MRKFFLSVVLVLAAITTLPFQPYASDNTDEEIKLYMGEIKTIPVNDRIKNSFIYSSVSLNSSRPISIRRISLVPAPIS